MVRSPLANVSEDAASCQSTEISFLHHSVGLLTKGQLLAKRIELPIYLVDGCSHWTEWRKPTPRKSRIWRPFLWPAFVSMARILGERRDEFHLECKLRFCYTQFNVRQMHWTKLSASLDWLYINSWSRRLTDAKTTDENFVIKQRKIWWKREKIDKSLLQIYHFCFSWKFNFVFRLLPCAADHRLLFFVLSVLGRQATTFLGTIPAA